MKLIHISAAVLLLGTGAAMAQTAPKNSPGGNVPLAQGPCSQGYEKSVQNGRMTNLSPTTLQAVDTNNDGRISKPEFDAACSKKLFGESKG